MVEKIEGKEFNLVNFLGKVAVCKAVNRSGWRYECNIRNNPKTPFEGEIPEADFFGTGLALCGFLKKNENLEDFIYRNGIKSK